MSMAAMTFTGELLNRAPLTAIDVPILCQLCSQPAWGWAGVNTGHGGGSHGTFHVNLPVPVCERCWLDPNRQELLRQAKP